MQELTPSTLSPKKGDRLLGTQWRCEGQVNDGIEFHELRFVAPNQVEGWSKEQFSSKPEHMFTATYKRTNEILQFSQAQETFQAVWIQQKLVAFVDGNTMVFRLIDAPL